MCGLCGKIHFDLGKPVFQDDIQKMTELIRHRGPDDCGYYLKGNIGLEFRRLSIINRQKDTDWKEASSPSYNLNIRADLKQLSKKITEYPSN